MTKSIELTQGYNAIVDDEAYEKYAGRKWWALILGDRYVYACNTADYTKVYLHRLIVGAKPGQVVDHLNGITLDDRYENLRIVTQSQNLQNSKTRTDNTSGFKGVSWYKNYSKWKAYIGVDGRVITLGYFLVKEDAARAYNEAAVRYYGPDARTNSLLLGDTNAPQ